jgi:hypothetical protein
MNTFTLFYGADKPVIVRGKNAARLASFAERNRGWHTFKQDRATRNAIVVCLRAGCIEINEDQFRWVYPS